MIIVSGKVRTRPGTIETVRVEMEAVITATRGEEGCIDYSYGVDVLDADVIIVLEYWQSWAALETHFKAPHMGPWHEALGRAGIVSRDLRFFEAGEERKF